MDPYPEIQLSPSSGAQGPEGATGFVTPAVVLVDTITAHGLVGLKRLVSIPDWVLLTAIAVPSWVAAAATGGHNGFVNGVVMNDQLLYLFVRSE